MEYFCSSKDSYENGKATNWETIFVKHTPKREHVSRLYEELLEHSDKISNSILFKWAKNLNRCSSPWPWSPSHTPCAGWMDGEAVPNCPPTASLPNCHLLHQVPTWYPATHTIKVVAPPGPVPWGQAALREAHLLGPHHLPGLQQGLVHQGVLQGVQEWAELPVSATRCVQLRGAEESLEGHLGGRCTAWGSIILIGEGDVRAEQIL